MAKRRNAAALFEVIHADKRFPTRHEPSSWSSWTPRLPGWLRLPRRERGGGGDGSGFSAAADAPVAPAMSSGSSGSSWSGSSGGGSGWSFIPSLPRLGVSLDPERGVVHFQMSYTGALVAGFALVMVVAVSYVVGKQGARQTVPALAEATSEELRAGPAQPSVLDVPVAMASAPLATGGLKPAAPVEEAPSPKTPAPQAAKQGARPATWTEPKPPATFYVTDTNRQVGLHYVIVQSYPPEERSLAEEALALLSKNGVPCSIETGLPYAPKWLSVVGYTGFDRVRAAEFEKYVAQINHVGSQFASGSKFKRFEPKPFKWRETSGKAAQ